jgi:hypothetical protein
MSEELHHALGTVMMALPWEVETAEKAAGSGAPKVAGNHATNGRTKTAASAAQQVA